MRRSRSPRSGRRRTTNAASCGCARTTWPGPRRPSRAPRRCLPGFAPVWANLGGTLGELDRPAEALAAFERALGLDPASPQALNNVGVVRRELGRLAESEAAFRQVIKLTPELAFGHYNLGHTLFLQGRFQAALAAYAAGQGRDPLRESGAGLAAGVVPGGDR